MKRATRRIVVEVLSDADCPVHGDTARAKIERRIGLLQKRMPVVLDELSKRTRLLTSYVLYGS